MAKARFNIGRKERKQRLGARGLLPGLLHTCDLQHCAHWPPTTPYFRDAWAGSSGRHGCSVMQSTECHLFVLSRSLLASPFQAVHLERAAPGSRRRENSSERCKASAGTVGLLDRSRKSRWEGDKPGSEVMLPHYQMISDKTSPVPSSQGIHRGSVLGTQSTYLMTCPIHITSVRKRHQRRKMNYSPSTPHLAQ